MSEIKSPEHYALMNGYDASDVMNACMSKDEVIGYWRGCAIKYLIRLGRKGTDEDTKKDAAKAAECARRLAELYYGN